MNIEEQIEKTAQYFDYLTEHKHNVERAWNEVKRKCPTILSLLNENQINEMKYRIEGHDQSKYSEDEFHAYRKHFYPITGEEPDDAGYEKAWQLHISRNDHHWQYWVNHDYSYDIYDKLLAYLEMICDWQAMGYKFGDTALQYYNKHKDKITLDSNWKDLIETVLTMLDDNTDIIEEFD